MQYQFKPSFFMTLLMLAFLALFISLGFWQIGRSEQKRVLKEQFAQNQQQILNISQLNEQSLAQNQYRILKLKGRFDNLQQFLLDNKIHQGKVGYEVLTPFMPTVGNKVILINRGWIWAGRTRAVLPKIEPVTGLITLTGLIKIPSKGVIVLSDKTETGMAKWPMRIQKIDLQKIAAKLNKPVASFIVLLNAKQAHGFIRDWKPINMRPEKHIGYAVQWFAFALVLLIIYFAVNMRKKKID